MTPNETDHWVIAHGKAFDGWRRFVMERPDLIDLWANVAFHDVTASDAAQVTAKMVRGELDPIRTYDYEATGAIVARHCREAANKRAHLERRAAEEDERARLTAQRKEPSLMSRVTFGRVWRKLKPLLDDKANAHLVAIHNAGHHTPHTGRGRDCLLCDILEEIE